MDGQTCFICPNGNGKMCGGGCGLACANCPDQSQGQKGAANELPVPTG